MAAPSPPQGSVYSTGVIPEVELRCFVSPVRSKFGGGGLDFKEFVGFRSQACYGWGMLVLV